MLVSPQSLWSLFSRDTAWKLSRKSQIIPGCVLSINSPISDNYRVGSRTSPCTSHCDSIPDSAHCALCTVVSALAVQCHAPPNVRFFSVLFNRKCDTWEWDLRPLRLPHVSHLHPRPLALRVYSISTSTIFHVPIYISSSRSARSAKPCSSSAAASSVSPAIP